jgi:NADH-quinone oxidoreductase subunit H
MMILVVAPVFIVILFWGGGPKLLIIPKYFLFIVLAIIAKNINPRVRIDQAIRFLWSKITLVAVLALLLAVIGY